MTTNCSTNLRSIVSHLSLERQARNLRAIWQSCLLVALCLTLCTRVTAAVLDGSGNNLPIPSINPGTSTNAIAPAQFPQLTTTGASTFSGTWVNPVHPNWVGTWTASGPRTNNISNGSTTFDFSSLPLGALPIGTFVRFGDVDRGAGQNETFTLRAYSDLAGNSPLSKWLDEPVGVRTVIGSGPGNSVLPRDMPAWSYSGVGSYTIDGNPVPNNPNIAFVLTNNQPIVRLDVEKTSNPYQLDLLAPEIVPEPSSLLLWAAATLFCVSSRRQR